MNAPIAYYTRTLGEASASALFEFRVSPNDYLEWATGKDRIETPSMHEGSAFHCALHEPDVFARRYSEIPNLPLRSAKDREAFLNCIFDVTGVALDDPGGNADSLRLFANRELKLRGSYVLTSESLKTLREMIDSLNKPCHKLARNLAAQGQKELEFRWIDATSGIHCKARIDSWDEQNGVLSDLKRTVAITRRKFKYAVLDHDYHYQEAFYRRALREAGADVKYACFVCGSPEGPVHPWAVYDIPEEAIAECDARISMDLMRLAECIAKNNWPSLNNGEPVTLDIYPERNAP